MAGSTAPTVTNSDGSSSFMGPVSASESANLSSQGIGNAGNPIPSMNFTPATSLNNFNPSSDYAYQAFLNGAGYTGDLAKAQANYARSSLQAQLAAGEKGYDQQLQQGLTNDLNASAARGGVNSSARLLSQANTQQNVNNARSAFEAGIADKQAANQFSLENALANQAIQQQNQYLAAYQRQLDAQNSLGAQQAAQTYAQQLLAYLQNKGS